MQGGRKEGQPPLKGKGRADDCKKKKEEGPKKGEFQRHQVKGRRGKRPRVGRYSKRPCLFMPRKRREI